MRIQVEDWCIPSVDIACLLPSARCREVPEEPVLGREGVDQARDPTRRAEEEALEHQVVDPAEQEISVTARVLQVGDPSHILRGFLDRDQPGLVTEVGEHLGRDIDVIGDRVVVDHDRQVGRPRDGPEMSDRLARIGLVDHGRQDHQAHDPDPMGVGRELAGPRGRALGDAGQNGDLSRDMVDRGAEDFQLLRVFERAILANRAQHDQAVNARLDHPIDVGQGRGDVQRLVGLELGRRCRKDPLPTNAHDQLAPAS